MATYCGILDGISEVKALPQRRKIHAGNDGLGHSQTDRGDGDEKVGKERSCSCLLHAANFLDK